jgi:hypothetical protein
MLCFDWKERSERGWQVSIAVDFTGCGEGGESYGVGVFWETKIRYWKLALRQTLWLNMERIAGDLVSTFLESSCKQYQCSSRVEAARNDTDRGFTSCWDDEMAFGN